MKRMIFTLAIFGLGLVLTGCPPTPSKDFLAVSLKAVQAKLKACQPSGKCPTEVLELAGIKRIIGVMADEKNRDLVIFGQTDKDSPPVYLEDFVVALRSAWRKYARLEGDVYYYSHPGCSIDPTPDAMRSMNALERRQGRFDPSDRETFVREWQRVCQMPQQVRVLGIPFNTRFAQVMVKADYDLKTLSNGTDALDLPGFIGMMEMKVRLARQKTGQERPSLSLNRFWLYPGETLFEEDAGVITIKQCFVRLLTEQMHADAKGEVHGSGGTESLAKTFSDNFTVLYRKIARQRPIYRDLENLFRLVALAEAVKSKHDDAATRFDLRYLLDSFPVREVKVEEWVPGRDAVRFEDFKRDNTTFYHRFSSCGGVDIAIKPEAGHFSTDTGGRLAKLKSDLQAARPGSGSPIVWGIPGQAGFLARYNLNSRIQETNRFNDLATAFVIVDRKPGYELFDGTASKLYSVAEIPELTRRINELAAADSARAVYVELQGFNTQGQMDAFAGNFKNQRLGAEVKARFLRRELTKDQSPELMLSSSAKLEEVITSNAPETQGRFKGMLKTVAKFVVQTADAVQRVTLTIYSKTPELAQAFVKALTSIFSGSSATGFHAKSIVEAANEALLQVEADFPNLKPEDLYLQFADELEHKHQVNLRSNTVETMVEAAE